MGIFGKPPDAKPADAPVAPPRPAPPDVKAGSAPHVPHQAPGRASTGPCVIAAKTTIKGDLTGDEDVVVDGIIEGQVRITRELRVGSGGVVKAGVEAASIIVSGEIIGDCQATGRVEIQASGKVTGNIRAPKIVIAEGAMFRGNSDMSPRKDDRKVAVS
jgi:cytoskeletal protein CcmA (bactofilin family)